MNFRNVLQTQEQDNTIDQQYVQNSIGYLINKNYSTTKNHSYQQYFQEKFEQNDKRTEVNKTYQQICGKYAGIYKSSQGVEKDYIRPQSLLWLKNGIHCLIGYQQLQKNNNNKNSRFDLHLINTQTKQKEKYFPARQGTIQGIGGINILNDGKSIILGDKGGSIYLLEYIANSATLYQRSDVKTSVEWINQIVSSPDDKKYALGDDKNELYIFDVESQQIEDLNMEGHGQKITSIDWHPFKAMIMSTGEDKQINVWCPQSKEKIFQMYNNMAINKALWHQNGNWILSCGKDQVAKIYDIRKHQKEMQTFKCTSEVKCLDWHPQNPSLFVTGEYDGCFTQWNVNSNLHIDKNFSIGSPVYDVKYHPFGDFIGVLSEDKQLKFFGQGKSDNEQQNQLNSNQLLQPLQAQSGQNQKQNTTNIVQQLSGPFM